MKTRPILFSGEMVRALLAGTKTQTRRMLNARDKKLFAAAASLGECSDFVESGAMEDGDQKYAVGLSRLGSPGDHLWCKETFFDTNKAIGNPRFGVAPRYIYRADYDYREKDRSIIGAHHWKPSIFMPRAASRITLEITAVRVERLQDISGEDAMAEGIETLSALPTVNAVTDYAELWESINGPGSWAANPWVWVVEFKRLEQNQNK